MLNGALILTGVLAVAVLALKWGKRKSGAVLDSENIEDALKHIYDFEDNKKNISIESIAGTLEITRKRASKLVSDMENKLLIELTETGYTLTPEGRHYALRVIRLHRLWERYLADETGWEEKKWHPLADQREHSTTELQAADMERKMGFPQFDPHGDPIPSREGDIAHKETLPLSALSTGQTACVVHVEDEPSEIYSQIIAEGIYPGMNLKVTSTESKRIRFWLEGEERILAPVLAGNVFVQISKKTKIPEHALKNLSNLSVGESAAISNISMACRGPARRRLMDIGLVPGTMIEAEIRSPSGGVTGYRVRGALVALRDEQALLIRIQK